MSRSPQGNRMRISFDLDEVLFVSTKTHRVEPPPVFPLNRIYRERLRAGTPELIHRLQKLGYEVWVYTSSFRTEKYIKHLFLCYGIRFDGIVNAQRHLKEVQGNRRERLPQKLPNHYRITLHVDDEMAICSLGPQYGFRTYHLDAPDDEWVEKILKVAERTRQIMLASGQGD